MSSYDEPELRRWRQQADAALGMAELGGPYPSWACFLCEQAAHLALKGILHAVGEQAAAWGHDLVIIEGRASMIFGADWPTVDAQARRLGRHYIPARYPDAHASGPPEDHYGDADAEIAKRDARAVLDAVDNVAALLGAADADHRAEDDDD